MNKQSGQILLIVVLSMVVALSVGLSIASRTISNLNISKQNEESQRAFQAAEAGLERAVRQVYTGGDTTPIAEGSLGNNSNFNVDIKSEPSSQIQLNGGDTIERAVGLDVWMSNYPDFASPYTGNVQLYWGQRNQDCGKTGTDYPPALEVLLIHGNHDNPQLLREVFDPCGRISGTNSGIVTENPPEFMGTPYKYRATFPSSGTMTSGLLFKVIPIFNSTRMGIEGLNGNLPAQGSVITSTGTAGDTVRKIQYFQSYPQIPNELFPYAIVSQNNGEL